MRTDNFVLNMGNMLFEIDQKKSNKMFRRQELKYNQNINTLENDQPFKDWVSEELNRIVPSDKEFVRCPIFPSLCTDKVLGIDVSPEVRVGWNVSEEHTNGVKCIGFKFPNNSETLKWLDEICHDWNFKSWVLRKSKAEEEKQNKKKSYVMINKTRQKCVPIPLPGGNRIYFIQGEFGGLIKIGFTSNLSSRFHGLQCSSNTKLKLLASIIGEPDKELELHTKFDNFRKHGEWFEPVPELLDFINSLG